MNNSIIENLNEVMNDMRRQNVAINETLNRFRKIKCGEKIKNAFNLRELNKELLDEKYRDTQRKSNRPVKDIF